MSFVLTRAVLLYGLVAAVAMVAILGTVHLPEIPLLRYAVFAAPLLGALVVVLEWYEAGAPPFRSPKRRIARTTGEARVVQRGAAPTS